MKNSRDYLAAIAAKHGHCSNYRLAKLLGLSTQAISNYQKGRPLTPEVVPRVAELAEVDAGEVYLAVQFERTKDDTVRTLLRRVAQRAGFTLALVVSGLLGAPSDAGAMRHNASSCAFVIHILAQLARQAHLVSRWWAFGQRPGAWALPAAARS